MQTVWTNLATAGSLTADAILILPAELGFCGLEEDFCGKLPDFLQVIS